MNLRNSERNLTYGYERTGERADQIARLRARLKSLRRRKAVILTGISNKSSELSDLIKAQRKRVLICTPEIADYWGIPKIEGGRRVAMNSVIFDILPDKPPRGKKDKRRPIISRLINGVNNACHHRGGHLVFVVAQYEESELHFRDCGQKVRELLGHCLSWNGISFGIDIDTDPDIDQRLRVEFGEFIKDAPAVPCYVLKERPAWDRVDPSDKVGSLLRESRSSLKRRDLSDEMIDFLEKKLDSMGYRLWPD